MKSTSFRVYYYCIFMDFSRQFRKVNRSFLSLHFSKDCTMTFYRSESFNSNSFRSYSFPELMQMNFR